MRPLRLTMTAFGPYAGTEIVDFDALSDLGLFVVAGNNGSGKTTIFDALHYSLYGTLPGRRSTYLNLRSDHAPATVDCRVTLDFRAHGADWRVERSPTQTRAKRRGTGTTQAPAQATLFRFEDGAPVAVTNRIEEVRAKCSELVGLSGKQFERVALLPQGEFSRVLQESGQDRRALLRTLFSSELFGDATNLLNEHAASATAKDRAQIDAIDRHQASLAIELAQLTGVAPSDCTGCSADELAARIQTFRVTELAGLTTRARQLEREATEASQEHQAARELGERIKRRTHLQRSRAEHERGRAQNDRDQQRLKRARAAVPVASNERSLRLHEHQHASADRHVDELREQINQALQVAGCPPLAEPSSETLETASARVAALRDTLDTRRESAARVRDLDALTKQSIAELRRLENESIGLDNQLETASAHLRQTAGELTTLDNAPDAEQCERELRTAMANLDRRQQFESAESEHRVCARRAIEIDLEVENLQALLIQTHTARSGHEQLQVKAEQAFAAFEEATRRRDGAVRYQDATEQLMQHRHQLQTAQQSADSTWDAFIGGTAARVAEALVDDEACPVCGSEELPAPARFDSATKATEHDVTEARRLVSKLQSERSNIETQIEALSEAYPGIASVSLAELNAEIATTKAMALGARTLAEQALQKAGEYTRVEAELVTKRQQQTELDTEIRELEQHRSRLEGSLGDLVHQPVSEFEHRLERAQQARSDADQIDQRRSKLTDQKHQLELDVERIGLDKIALENRRTSATDQHNERRAGLSTATTELDAINRELADTSPDGSIDGADSEQREQAARHAHQLLADLTTALAVATESADAARRARSIVDDRLAQSPFDSVGEAVAAFLEPDMVAQLDAQTTGFAAAGDRLRGQLSELADLPDAAPDLAQLAEWANTAHRRFTEANHEAIASATSLNRISDEFARLTSERSNLQSADLATRRLERVAALVKGDNDRNTSLENWVLAAHLRDVVDLANIRLARSTHQRFQLCVLDDGDNKRSTWGLDLGVEDTVTGTRRPTAGLSGGELFQASLALALGLADAVMNQSAGVQIDALFIDEGFGSLDEVSVERAIDLLDELRDQGALVGVITHVPALLDALPLGVRVIDAPDGHGSTIRQDRAA